MRPLLAVLVLVPLAACMEAPLADPDAGAPAAAALSWASHAAGPLPRVEVASATLGERVYVIGGFTGDGATTAAVEVYDAAADAWTDGPDYPFPIHHSAAVAIDGEGVLVLGGWLGAPLPDPVPPAPIPSALAFRLAPDGTTWEPIAPLPAPRGSHTAGVIGGKVYVVGGVTERLELATDSWVYDPAADAWEAIAPMPTPRDHVTSVVLRDRLHVLAGQRLSHADVLAAHEAFDPATGEWVRLADVPTARNAMVAGVARGVIVVAGGQTDVDVFDVVEGYDSTTDSWRALASLPQPRHGGAAGTVGERFFSLLGGTVAGAVDDLSDATFSIG